MLESFQICIYSKDQFQDDEGKSNQYAQAALNYRSVDSKNFRETIAIVQKFIQEVDFELGYIWTNLNTNARMYLNTLAFFVCFQARVLRDEKKIHDEVRLKKAKKQYYFEQFQRSMDDKIK